MDELDSTDGELQQRRDERSLIKSFFVGYCWLDDAHVPQSHLKKKEFSRAVSAFAVLDNKCFIYFFLIVFFKHHANAYPHVCGECLHRLLLLAHRGRADPHLHPI